MIKLNINNNQTIEASQERSDGKINIDVLDNKGNVEYYYNIAPEDFTMLLNYYQYKTDKGEQIF